MVKLSAYAKAQNQTQTVEAGVLLNMLKRPFQSQMKANHNDLHEAIKDHYKQRSARYTPKITTDYMNGAEKSGKGGFNEEHGVSVTPSRKEYKQYVPSSVHLKQHPETGEWHAVAENRSGDETKHGRASASTPYMAAKKALVEHDNLHPAHMTGGAMYRKPIYDNMSTKEGMNAGYGYRSPTGFSDKE